ncbi:hypothetical protein GCM10010406_03370 [Streptomyces thermolineatus]|uniref:Integral membrane protein n=1 Tax=Streptomyces thermolineatus TaxID=44033 RepID=A0ABN3KVQ4_9ACTN
MEGRGQDASGPGGTGPGAPDAEGAGRTGPGRTGRAVAYVVLAVLGAATGVAGGLVQAALPPFGLLLALAGSAALFHGGARLTGTRAGAAVPAGAWLAAVIWLSTPRAEGDFAFAAGIGPYAFLLVGVLIGVMCATLPPPGGAGTRGARSVR